MVAAQLWMLIAISALGLLATFTQMRRLNHRMLVGFAELHNEICEFRDEIRDARADIAGRG